MFLETIDSSDTFFRFEVRLLADQFQIVGFIENGLNILAIFDDIGKIVE